MSGASAPSVASTTSRIPGGPKTKSVTGSAFMTQCVVMTSFRSVRWSLWRCVTSTALNIGGSTPAPASRMSTPRPQSTRNVDPAERTSVAGPARSGSGSGPPVPNNMICMPDVLGRPQPAGASDVVAAEDVADRRVREDSVERFGDDRGDREHREFVELLLARDRQRVRQHDLADRGVCKPLDGWARQHTVAGGDIDVRRPACGQQLGRARDRAGGVDHVVDENARAVL